MSEQVIITITIFFLIFGGISILLIILLVFFEKGYQWTKKDNEIFKRLRKDNSLVIDNDVYDDNHHLDIDK